MKRFWMAGSLFVLSSIGCGAGDTSGEMESGSIGKSEESLTATSPAAGAAATLSIQCGAKGTAVSVGGIEACSCQDGYAGTTCDVCATGYTRGSTSADCIATPVNKEVVIEGTERTIAYGSTTTLSAVSTRPGSTGAPAAVAGTWSVQGTNGCIASVERPDACLSQIEATSVLFKAPPTGTELSITQVTFTPAGGGPAVKTGIKAGPPEEMPINGSADVSTLNVVNKVLAIMKSRCIGAASLGIARHGKVVAALGLGMKDGRSAQKIWNSDCSDNETDPFKPGAGEMRADTPYMIGSVSKAPAYATARYAIEKALRAQDVDVRIVAQTQSRVVTATRTTNDLLSLEVWDLAADGSFTKKGLAIAAPRVKDFSVVRMGDTRFVVAMRTSENKRYVSAYTIDASGTPVAKTLFGDTQVKQVQVTALKNQRVMIASRLADDSMQVRTYKLENDGSLTFLASEQGGIARDVRLIGLPGTSRVVGVARLGNPDRLKFIVWNVSDTGALERIHETELGDDTRFRDIQKFELTALSASRFVIGVRRLPSDDVSAYVVAVDGADGEVTIGGATHVPLAYGGFRMQAVDATHFGVVTHGNGNGRLHRMAVGGNGIPYQMGQPIATGPSRGADLAVTAGGGLELGFVTSVRDANDQLALTSFGVQADALVKRKTAKGLATVDYDWQDSDIEDLSLVGFDFPDGLVSKRLHSLVAGYVEPPFHVNAVDGNDLPLCIASSAPGYPKADAGFKKIRLRDFFAHRAGLARSNPSAGALLGKIGAIRGLDTKQAWVTQEANQRAHFGEANASSARQAVGLSATPDPDAPDGFLFPRLGLEDMLVGSTAQCLPYAQGTYVYSNTDPVWIRAVMEHVTGQPYTAPVGNPDAVAGTLLEEFTRVKLGVTSGALTGMFARPAAPDAQGNDRYKGPRRRHWNGTSYYPLASDVKRPYCVWSGDGCTYKGSLDWLGNAAKVPIDLDGNGESAPTGSLGVQIVPHLKFLSKYWAGGYDDTAPAASFNPRSGELRKNVWSIDDAHNGADDGMWAFALQYGPKCGGVAAGVDITVSFNQLKDKVCTTNTCEKDMLSYMNVQAAIGDAVCATDWTKATPVPGLND